MAVSTGLPAEIAPDCQRFMLLPLSGNNITFINVIQMQSPAQLEPAPPPQAATCHFIWYKVTLSLQASKFSRYAC